MDDLRKTQMSFARKALAEPQHQFEDLYHLICRKDWVETALDAVLNNSGSKTAGIDGISRKDFEREGFRNQFIEQLRNDLKRETFQPTPVRRTWIPKSSGGQRPLGIPTIRDRVVQMLLKMLMEPIWESDFLDCSNGFRPGRRTWDSVALCYDRIHKQNKFYWVIEGDIKGCFDHINHSILLKLVRRRIADRRIVNLIDQLLRAGVFEAGLFQHTPEGTPQGGIVSPLLANIYLHEFDLWWWKHYGNIGLVARQKRRRQHLGNCLLTRYADDFILICNGSKEEVLKLREEVREFLWNQLHLELSLEKTHVTHATEGFNFLGYHVQLRFPSDNDPWLHITPSEKSVQRLRDKVKQMTTSRTLFDMPEQKLKAINRVIRGWANYYRNVSFIKTANKLDWWVNDRFFLWLKKKHRVGARRIMEMYKVREVRKNGSRWTLGMKDQHGEMVYLYQMADAPRITYHPPKRNNPYLGEEPLPLPITEDPFPALWTGASNPEYEEREIAKRQALERDGYRCVRCGSQEKVHVHHILALSDGGTHELANLETLCERCHVTTPSYGRKRDSTG
jgi:group II intron reverse transcriptase/maturase